MLGASTPKRTPAATRAKVLRERSRSAMLQFLHKLEYRRRVTIATHPVTRFGRLVRASLSAASGAGFVDDSPN